LRCSQVYPLSFSLKSILEKSYSAKAESFRSYVTLLALTPNPSSRKYMPILPSPYTQGEQCTSLLLMYLIAALPIEESGTTVKYELSMPRLASDTATLASAPPYLTVNSLVILIFSLLGGERRSNSSPMVIN